MSNRLTSADSLYLKQHAENPVAWWAWGETAFEAARKENKPVLVSIGYSSCHWCHVMAHECFENDYIAGIMNEHFVNIKVDREEHPEVDQFYMEAVQMITRHGGWPLNAFCFPDGRPFFGGTYFPPQDRGNGLIPWPQLLIRISNYFHQKRDELEENAEAIIKNMEHADRSIGGDPSGSWNAEFLVSAASAVTKQHDDVHGGFGEAPKFPQSMTLEFLLQLLNTSRAQQESPLADRLGSVLNRTLKAMAFGGIFDQIGGGFSRYSVDSFWLIPHFEKMLYDNGLLLDLYAKAWMQFRDPLYRDVASEIVRWMDREMSGSESPLFYASLDADSEGEEGKFYVWTPEQVHDALPGRGAEAQAFCQAYGISNEGNFEHGTSNPALLSGDRGARHTFREVRDALYEVRTRRVWPGLDTKQILSWNALAIRGRVEFFASQIDRDGLRAEGERLEWILDHLFSGSGPGLGLVYPGSGPSREATLSDAAFLLETLLAYTARADWVDPGSFHRWRDQARSLAEKILLHYGDPDAPGCFFSPSQDANLGLRRKEWVDNAIPSGNSSLCHSFASLYTLTGDDRWNEAFLGLRSVLKNIASKMPTGAGHALSAFTREATGIPLLKVAGAEALDAILPLLRERTFRQVFFEVVEPASAPGTYQICLNTQCLPPESEPAEVADQIASPAPQASA